MLNRIVGSGICVLAVWALAGCRSASPTTYASTREISVAPASEEFDRVWQAAQETLRRHRFVLDRVDHREGLVTTLPEGSQHFFEFWRHDVNTARDFWESVLNPIRRWVEVRITAEGDSDRHVVEVVVHKERLSAPDRQFNSSGAAYQYFGESLPSTMGIERVTHKHNRWLDLGRDAAMEDYLVRRIIDRAQLTDS